MPENNPNGISDADAINAFASMIHPEEPGQGSIDEAPSAPVADQPEEEEPAAEAPEEQPLEDDGPDESPAPEGEEEGDVPDSTPEPEEDLPPTLSFEYNGEEITLDADEAKNGYLRHGDYTRKTQALAEERKAIETQKEETHNLHVQAQENLQKALLHAQADLAPFAGIDFQQLAQEDRYAAEEKSAEYMAALQRYQEVEVQANAIQEQINNFQGEALKRQVAEETEKLHTLMPELLDSDAEAAFRNDIADYGRGLGFSDQELGGVYDHRHVLLLDKARKYDQLMAKKEQIGDKKVKKAPKQAITKGVSVTPEQKQTRARKDRMAQMARAGRDGQNTDAFSIEYFTELYSKDS